ncbi:MAG: cytochrome c-type biogenesis protein CcmH [Magnetococcales bacterium]|nr:cytochrome c-type biogenesis protein CcmH [Magnetococcales bacterium]
MKSPAAACLLAALLLALPVGAATRDEDPTEALVRHIAKDLRCAVCQNQSVYESNSDLAKDMLRVIRDKVREGQSEGVIRDYFHQRYGDYIYLEPTTGGMNRLLWLGPFVGLLAGGWALLAAMRKWRAKPTATPGNDPPPAAPDAAMQERIRQELEQMRL